MLFTPLWELKNHSIHSKYFPNPAKEKATIIFDNLSDKTIQLIDLNGVIVFELKSNSNQIDLDLFRYSKGVYILKLIEGGNINIEKLLIN